MKNTPPFQAAMWPTLFRKLIPMEGKWERVELPDGDFLDLVWDKENAEDVSKPIVLFLHGLAGNIHSPYATGLMKAFSKKGWRPVLMHFRGCSGDANRLPRGYHSGDTEDAAFIVQYIIKKYPSVPIAGVGISVGGNVLLKWMGETGSSNPLIAAVAVSVPFELAAVADRFMLGASRIYQWRLLSRIKNDMFLKFKNIDCPFDIHILNRIENFWEFDDKITAPIHGFKDVHEYYRHSSSKQYLKNIAVPTLIIHSRDDPFMRPETIPTQEELAPCIQLDLTERGGHVGFIYGNVPGVARFWLEERIPEFLSLII
jgi:predicted alpha/beta-fold hydrolase